MDTFTVQSKQRGELIDITSLVKNSLSRAGVRNGLGVVFLLHTTAGLTINDHLDPAVTHAVLLALERAVPRDQPGFRRQVVKYRFRVPGPVVVAGTQEQHRPGHRRARFR